MKTYEIIDLVVNHPELGILNKKCIVYSKNGTEEFREFYVQGMEIREGYKLQGTPDTDFIDELTPVQLNKLANKLNNLLK